MTDTVGYLANFAPVVFYMQMERYCNLIKKLFVLLCAYLLHQPMNEFKLVLQYLCLSLFVIVSVALTTVGFAVPCILFLEIEHLC